ncbi:MAG TPA: MFS transporter [Methanomicrobiales archaeon]|nr:MFS transporter [Methanomicrobiales archaeon]
MPGENERKITLAIATIASFFVPYLTSSITVALPVIGREFSLDAVSLGWVVSSYVLSTAILIVPVGRLADIYGRRRLFLVGIVILTVASLFASLAWSAASLVAFRILQGAGGAMIFTTSVAIVTAVYPADGRGRALGITLASVYAGLSVGPFIGGILTGFIGWRSIFLAIVPLGVLVVWLTMRSMKVEWIDDPHAGFDFTGSALYAVALFGVMYGLTLVPEPMAAASILLGALLLGGFLWWEVQCKSPLLDMSVFHRNLAFAFSNIAALINYAATYAVAFLLSLYLQYTRGLAPEAAGMILVAQPLVQMIFSPSAGRLSDRIEPRIVASAGMSLTAIGLLFFVFLSEETPLWLIVGVLLVLGLGYALFSSPNTNAIMSSVAPRHYGVASSMVATMRATGQLASIAIAMMVFSLFMGRVQVTPEVYPLFLTSVQVAFLILGVLCLIGVFASYARGRIREAVEEPVGRRQPSVR